MKVETVDFLTIPTATSSAPCAGTPRCSGSSRARRSRDAERHDLVLEPRARRRGVKAAHVGRFGIRVADVEEARRELESEGVEFLGETVDTGVCHMGFFKDPDGNTIVLHRRYAPRG